MVRSYGGGRRRSVGKVNFLLLLQPQRERLRQPLSDAIALLIHDTAEPRSLDARDVLRLQHWLSRPRVRIIRHGPRTLQAAFSPVGLAAAALTTAAVVTVARQLGTVVYGIAVICGIRELQKPRVGGSESSAVRHWMVVDGTIVTRHPRAARLGPAPSGQHTLLARLGLCYLLPDICAASRHDGACNRGGWDLCSGCTTR